MSTRRFVLRSVAFTGVFWSVFLSGHPTSGQPKPAAPRALAVQEFPVTMRQKVIAGKTPVGAKVEAKLTIATLADGMVIPEGAVFSGEVVESAAKSATAPCRLAIRMDSAHWKKGSAPIKVYLTMWYYPVRMPTDEDPLATPRGRTRSYDPNLPAAHPFPGRPMPGGPGVLPSNISDTRVVMKEVESTRQSDGALVLTSAHSNIKLDKTTTYVLAMGDLMPAR